MLPAAVDVLGLVGAGKAKTNRSRSVLGLLGWWSVVARPLRVTLVSCIFFHSADSLALCWVPGGGQRIPRWPWRLTIGELRMDSRRESVEASLMFASDPWADGPTRGKLVQVSPH